MSADQSCAREQLGPALLGVLAAAQAALEACNRPVGLAHLAPGSSVAWDNCCEGYGQLWVRVLDMFPSGRPFPTTDLTQPCDGLTLLGVRVGVGVVRCAHTLSDDGNPPSAEQMTADTLGSTADATALLHAIECDIPQIRQVRASRLVNWLPQGPSGGCAGGEWEILLGLDDCTDCTDAQP